MFINGINELVVQLPAMIPAISGMKIILSNIIIRLKGIGPYLIYFVIPVHNILPRIIRILISINILGIVISMIVTDPGGNVKIRSELIVKVHVRGYARA